MYFKWGQTNLYRYVVSQVVTVNTMIAILNPFKSLPPQSVNERLAMSWSHLSLFEISKIIAQTIDLLEYGQSCEYQYWAQGVPTFAMKHNNLWRGGNQLVSS